MSWLDEQEFYELMQAYRHCSITDFVGVVAAFEAVKAYIRTRMLDETTVEVVVE